MRKLYGAYLILQDGSKEKLSITMLDKAELTKWLEQYLDQNHALASITKRWVITTELI